MMNNNTPAIILWDKAYNRNGDPHLPRTAVNALRTYMNNNTLKGFVRGETLAKDTGLSLRQVRRQIAANIDAGWLEVTSSGHSGGKANDYRLTFPAKGVIGDTITNSKGVMDVTISEVKGDTGVTIDYPKGDVDVTITHPKGDTGDTLSDSEVAKGDADVTQRVTSMTSKGDTDVTPTTPITTPRTSPKEKFSRETISVPLEGPDIATANREATAELNGDTGVTLCGGVAEGFDPFAVEAEPQTRVCCTNR